jgi:hypothetical protein
MARGEHSLLFRSMEGRRAGLHPTSSLGINFFPGGQILNIGAKLKTGTDVLIFKLFSQKNGENCKLLVAFAKI